MEKIDKILEIQRELNDIYSNIWDEIETMSSLDEKLEDLKQLEDYKIHDIDNFEDELYRCGLLTKTLEDFISNYIKFDNNKEV